MFAIHELLHKASTLKELFLNEGDSEILEHGDDLLLFLNRLQDVLHQRAKVKIPTFIIDDIISRLESNPKLTLQDKSVHERLLNLFLKLQVS
jgi:hypothetical protein